MIEFALFPRSEYYKLVLFPPPPKSIIKILTIFLLHCNSQSYISFNLRQALFNLSIQVEMCFNVVAVWSCLCENPEEAEQTMCDLFPHCGRTGFGGEGRERQMIQAEGICPDHNHH